METASSSSSCPYTMHISQQIQQMNGFELLFLLLAMQYHFSAYAESNERMEPEEITDLLEELQQSYRHLFEPEESLQVMDVVEESNEEKTDSMPIDVFLEICISLLTKSSALIRDVVLRAFRAICNRIESEHSLAILLNAISEKTSFNDRFPKDTATIMDSEANEIINESRSSSDEENDKVDQISPSGYIEDSDVSIDIEQADIMEMTQLDDQLSEMFRTLKQRKKPRNLEHQRASFQFKCRLLDLLEIVLKKLHRKPIIFRIVVPLLQLRLTYLTGNANNDSVNAFSSKLDSILSKKLFKLKDFPRELNDSEVEFLLSQFEIVWKLAVEKSNRHQKENLPSKSLLIGNAIHFLVRVLISNRNSLVLEKLSSFLREALTQYASKKGLLTIHFFSELLRRHSWLGWYVLVDVVQLSISARSHFLRFQLFALIPVFLPRYPIHELAEEQEKFSGNLSETDFIDSKAKMIMLRKSFSNLSEAFSQFLAMLLQDTSKIDTSHLKEIFASMRAVLCTILLFRKVKKTDLEFAKEITDITKRYLLKNEEISRKNSIKAIFNKFLSDLDSYLQMLT